MASLAHCPICKNRIMRPVWLSKKFTAYCERCGRAYVDREILWLPEKRAHTSASAMSGDMRKEKR